MSHYKDDQTCATCLICHLPHLGAEQVGINEVRGFQKYQLYNSTMVPGVKRQKQITNRP